MKPTRFKTDGVIRADSVVDDDNVFVGSSDGKLYALRKSDGKKIWSLKTRDAIVGSPAISDNTVIMNPEVNFPYGLFLLAQGEFDQSYTYINIARALNPLYYSVASVAWIYAMQDRHEEAWEETEKLLTFQPHELQYHRSAHRLFENAGNQK